MSPVGKERWYSFVRLQTASRGETAPIEIAWAHAVKAAKRCRRTKYCRPYPGGGGWGVVRFTLGVPNFEGADKEAATINIRLDELQRAPSRIDIVQVRIVTNRVRLEISLAPGSIGGAEGNFEYESGSSKVRQDRRDSVPRSPAK